MTDDQIGPRLKEIDYGDEITGIDYLTGFEYPISRLIHVSSLEDEFTANEAEYIARFCHETQYGVGTGKVPPVFLTRESLEVVRKAKAAGIEPEIRLHD